MKVFYFFWQKACELRKPSYLCNPKSKEAGSEVEADWMIREADFESWKKLLKIYSKTFGH